METPHTTKAELLHLFQHATAELAHGRLDTAREAAVKAKDLAETLEMPLAVGRAFALHAQADVVDSQFHRADQWLRRAVEKFLSVKSRDDLAVAYALAGYVSCTLGNNDQAVNSTYLAAKLTEGQEPRLSRVQAMNYLGVSLFWAGQHELAQDMFDVSIWEAQRMDRQEVAFHPLINKAAGEACRVINLRYSGHLPPTAQPLQSYVGAALQNVHTAPVATLGTGTEAISLVLLEGFASIASSWAGDFQSAVTFADNCEQAAERLSQRSWLRALLHIARAELALAQRQWDRAQQAADDMAQQAQLSEHRQMYLLSQKVTCSVLELQHGSRAERMRAQIDREVKALPSGDVAEAEALAENFVKTLG